MTVNVKFLIESLVEASIDEALRGFNLAKFKQIAATSKRPESKEEEEEFVWSNSAHPEVAFARQYLPEMGEGSSRIAFALSSGKVLKIAKNKYGFEQNRVEIGLFTHSKNNHLVTKIFDYAPDYKWIISELVKPFAKGQLTQYIGFDDQFVGPILSRYKTFEDFQYAMSKQVVPDPNDKTWAAERIRVMLGILRNPKASQFMKDMFEMRNTHNLEEEDIHAEHFGVTVDGQVRLFDYGYDDDVATLYRGPKR